MEITLQNTENKDIYEEDIEISSKSIEKIKRYDLTPNLKEKLKEFPEVLEFIQKLQECIEKQRKKLSKLKKKRHKSKGKHVETQTESTTVEKSLTEEITEAAQQTLQKNGFVYDDTSGLYYDYNSGYYYNAEYGLYYDGNTGTYLKYNQDTKEYEFHSQVVVAPSSESQKKERKEKRRRPKRKGDKTKDNAHANKRRRPHSDGDLEEGECSDCSQNSSNENNLSYGEDETSCDSIDYAKQYPPCMRVIVEETKVTNFKQGSLHLITYEGGTLGREGAHAILIPDINISKYHLNFTYSKESGQYLVTDVGSRNGTYLNGKRLSPSKMESSPCEIVHGSRLQIGGTILLCHIHLGTQTCGHCEPGLIQNKNEREKDIAKSSKSIDHKEQLKKLRKKFGITSMDQGKTNPGDGYTDRAQVRRETVGSQNPHEKTQVASINESISSDNKGFKMLSKMGWKEGQPLGKDNHGLLEPVELVSNPGTSGMGSSVENFNVEINKEVRNNHKIWQKAQERYKLIPVQSENIFEDV